MILNRPNWQKEILSIVLDNIYWLLWSNRNWDFPSLGLIGMCIKQKRDNSNSRGATIHCKGFWENKVDILHWPKMEMLNIGMKCEPKHGYGGWLVGVGTVWCGVVVVGLRVPEGVSQGHGSPLQRHQSWAARAKGGGGGGASSSRLFVSISGPQWHACEQAAESCEGAAAAASLLWSKSIGGGEGESASAGGASSSGPPRVCTFLLSSLRSTFNARRSFSSRCTLPWRPSKSRSRTVF